ncbi:beta-lactamase-like protein [Mrakia frigida]|uniref:MBL fold metallo-hydrolase n=1 Tax=Mrakia frigida TaxID=29902 RepID=UPI003FCC0129
MSASTSTSINDDELEIILLGTGTSGQLPNVSCLTNHLSAHSDDDSETEPCRTCLSTLSPEGSKNVRRNTSAIVRGNKAGGGKSTILVDCGKSFLSSALEFFPKFGLRKIDAVLLTHPHADAINGLDDLRGWTLKGVVQPFIKVYCSQHTLDEIASSWPYMVELGKATGGGDVPAFEWVVIKEDEDFWVEGIKVSPLNVHHGRFFSSPPPPGSPPPPPPPTLEPPPILPFYCLGFIFHPHIVYMSDVSYIPAAAWAKLLPSPNTAKTLTSSLAAVSLSSSSHPPTNDVSTLPTPPYSPPITPRGSSSSNSTASDEDDQPKPHRFPVLILDTLFLKPHTSHFGILQSLQTILRLNPLRTYLSGFAHHHSHEEWEAFGRDLDGTPHPEGEEEEEFVNEARGMVGEVGEEARRRGVWVRPGWDGLRVVCDSKGAREEGPEEQVQTRRAWTRNSKIRGLSTPPREEKVLRREAVEGTRGGCCCP